MHKIIEILPNLPDRAMTTAEVAKAIRKDPRTVQSLGKSQIIKSEKEARPGGGMRRMFDPESVRQYLENPGQLKPKAETLAVAIREPAQKLVKKSQAERALDTVSLLANVVATMNKDRDMFIKALEVQNQQSAKSLEAVLGTVLDRVFAAQKADREESRARSAHA